MFAVPLCCVTVDHGRTIPGTVKGKKITKLFITDGRGDPLVGKCVYFLREKREDITPDNVMVSCLSLIWNLTTVVGWNNKT